MRAIKSFRVLFVSAVASVLALLNGMPSFAASADTCTVNVPCAIIDASEDIPADTAVELEISSYDGSDARSVTMGHGDGNLSLSFSEPGNYRYTVKQKSCSDHNVALDKSVYVIDVLVQETGGGLASAIAITGTGKTDKIKFENSRVIPGSVPNTGVTVSYGVLAVSLASAFVMIVSKKRKDDGDDK